MLIIVMCICGSIIELFQDMKFGFLPYIQHSKRCMDGASHPWHNMKVC